MKQLLAPIVGSHFRPPAKAVLACLPAGQSLHLDPEPDNPYDPNAIRVLVKPSQVSLPQPVIDQLTTTLIGYGTTWGDFITSDSIHLGYIPQSGTKTDTLHCGNREFLQAATSSNRRLDSMMATLSFSPTGQPLVRLSLEGDLP